MLLLHHISYHTILVIKPALNPPVMFSKMTLKHVFPAHLTSQTADLAGSAYHTILVGTPSYGVVAEQSCDENIMCEYFEQYSN